MTDVIIIGGGAAGLSAALWLGRCGRDTLLFDAGEPRNAASRGLHGYLTRDGIAPGELRAIGRSELAAYPSVRVLDEKVRTVAPMAGGFEVVTATCRERARLLLLATGRVDPLPELPGAREFYGRGIYHCPYCDGWEHRGRSVAVLGHEDATAQLAALLRTWTQDLLACTQGTAPGEALRRLATRVEASPIVRLEAGPEGRLARLHFANGSAVACGALFFSTDCRQRSELPAQLGCAFDDEGSVRCDAHAATNVPGLFVAGNVRGGVHLAITAAAEGAEAALAINRALLAAG